MKRNVLHWVRLRMGTECWTTPRRTRMAVPPPAVGLSVRWQTLLASRMTWPGLRNFSLESQISTPCWQRKCYSSSFQQRIPSEFQQACRRALHRTILLGRCAIFGHEENNDLQDSQRAGYSCGEGEDGREKPTSQFHSCFNGEAIVVIRDVL